MLNNYKRRKAFLGAAIGAIVGIAGSAISANKQKKMQEQQYALQRQSEAINKGVTSAANLTQAFANANEEDKTFRNRFFLYGGRRKAAWGAADTTELINSLGSIGSNIATSIVGNAQQQIAYPTAMKPVVGDDKDDKAVYDSAARSEFLNNYYRTATMRLGGSKRSRRC